jgi:hypothetical protein
MLTWFAEEKSLKAIGYCLEGKTIFQSSFNAHDRPAFRDGFVETLDELSDG